MEDLSFKYVNINGEALYIKRENRKLWFHHEDIHQENEWINIDDIGSLVLSIDEVKVIKTFIQLHDDLLPTLNYY